MCDVDELLSDLEPGNPMVEAVTGAFGSIFGFRPKQPVAPLVDWIVHTSALPRTQVDNFVRAHCNDPGVVRAINGDEASRCVIMKQIALALGIDVFNDAFTVPEILDAARTSRDNLTEAALPRGINRKPRTFCRAPHTRVPPAKLTKLPLEEWLATQCGLPGEGVKDYLASHPGDETIRLAREGDTVAKYSLAQAIGMALGIPEYENVSGTGETVLAARKASSHPVDEAAGVPGNPLVEHVEYRKGHKDSQGEDAPWVIVSCKTGKILSSHKTKEKAEEHLGQMEYFKHKK